MADKIKVTPAELTAQATKLSDLSQSAETIVANAQRALSLLFSATVNTKAAAMGIQGSLLLSNVNVLAGKLATGAAVATNCATTYEDVDAALAKISKENIESGAYITNMEEAPAKADLETYTEKVTHTEYAKLCELWYKASKADDPRAEFIRLVNEHLPENDPLRNVAYDQLTVVDSKTGLDALIITGGDTAIVIFEGTQDGADVATDALLAAGSTSPQEIEAIKLVKNLAKEYDNIVLTGHSLGGYLATAATLKVDGVTECIAFDPPGRYDAHLQYIFNRERVNEITTYEAAGSPVSDGLSLVSNGINQNFNVNKVSVDGDNNTLRHGIKQIFESMNSGDKYPTMESAWQ